MIIYFILFVVAIVGPAAAYTVACRNLIRENKLLKIQIVNQEMALERGYAVQVNLKKSYLSLRKKIIHSIDERTVAELKERLKNFKCTLINEGRQLSKAEEYELMCIMHRLDTLLMKAKHEA